MTTLQKDPLQKMLLRTGYRAVCGALVLLNMPLPRRQGIAVYYGGARRGDIGGPLVKVKRLREHFPEARLGCNVVYTLSNAPYLPAFAFRLLKARGIPVVHNQNGVFYKAWYAGDWEAQNRRMATSYHAADWVFYQSDFCRRTADRFLGERRGPGEVLYNAVDTQHFRPALPGLRDSGAPFTFLISGKIGNHLAYRLESTIAGLNVARKAGLDARLTIAGWVEGQARARAEALAREMNLGGCVTYHGSYTQAEAPSIYCSADAYVMTKHNDPCPNTVLEALACGLPILYSESGGVPELAGGDAGVALPCPEDWERPRVPTADEIGAGMLRIAANHGEFSVAARRRAIERFDIAHWIERHRVVFDRLIAEYE